MNCSTRSCSLSLVVVTLLGIILLLLPLGGQSFAQSAEDHHAWLQALDSLSSERMLADVTTLSNPAFNGRQTGTADDASSAKWIAEQFLASGLSLASTPVSPTSPIRQDSGRATGFMTTVVTVPKIAPDPVLRISTASDSLAKQLGTDYLPILDSPSAVIRGPIVFVGYGIVDATQGIDDYAGVDTTNAIVLFFRGKPTHYKGTISHADKVRLARQKGALGYLTATGPVLSAYEARRGVTGEPSAFYGLSLPLDTLPGAWISTTLAEQILAAPDHAQPSRLHELQENLNRSPAAQSISTGRYGSLDWQTRSEEGVLMNVLASLPGNDPQKTDDIIVIGAHRDHFGRQAGLLFPGADDNASGTAVILEVARTMAKVGLRGKRTVLFVSFSGEEQGLVGSRLYRRTASRADRLDQSHDQHRPCRNRKWTTNDRCDGIREERGARSRTDSWSYGKARRVRILSRRRSRPIQGSGCPDRHRCQRWRTPTLSSAHRYRRYDQSGDSANRGPVCPCPHLATGECAIEQTRG